MERFEIRIHPLAVLLLLVAGIAASCAQRKPESTATAEISRGEQGYLASCAMCHGPMGAGNGPLAAALAEEGATVPAHLDADKIKAMGIDEVKRVIREGGLHTGRSNLMPAWGAQLDSTLIDDIAEYVMTLPGKRPETPRQTTEDYLAAPPGSAADGRLLYVTYCSICHGPEGKGNGFYADTLYMRNGIRPRNLTETAYFSGKSDQQLYETIALGGGHAGKSTFMPAWNVTLTPAQIKSLISYVRAISGTQSKP